MVHEIEIKALLTEQQHAELRKTLPVKFKKINEDAVTTVKFKPKDVRVRYSEKLNEIVFKDEDATALSRKEISVNLRDNEDSEKMISILRELGFNNTPPWLTRREEFVCKLYGFEYTLSLQHIENFAYILEAEALADDDKKHIPVLKEILSGLGCEPIEPEQFKIKIEEYIRKNSK